ncbi:hypothetical protein M422DRAFT_264056 [Sphaerobolus stellatus SS14]|uniref:Uncharacterized protein n=1 Tax=Sphaerobolus stellatus (strain SS14) TaxID=990650 RepID=A0A0C9UGQ1_SPHS4|nr:hypothetical protein M422DRAFT_264056 [Sphaerobolus stellatus SS14]
MNPTISTPHPTQSQSYADAVTGSGSISSSPTHSISPMDYIDSDDQSPMEDVTALIDESQVCNNLPTQPTNSNKCHAKEDLPVPEPHAKTSLPNFKKKKISTNLGTPRGQCSAHIPIAESTAINTWPTIADANNTNTRSQQAVNTQGTGMQPPNASTDSIGPSVQQDNGPKIHRLEASKLYTCTHLELCIIFQSHPGKKMVFYPPGKEPSNPMPLVLGVCQFLQELFPHNRLGTLIIGTLCIVKLGDEHDFKTPFPIFVGNLTLQEKQLLLSHPVWVTPSLALFALEFLPPPSSFVMTLHSFTVPPKATYEENVRAVVHDKIKFSAAFSGFIHKFHDNIPPPPNTDDNVSTHVVNYVLNSVNIKLLKVIENGLDVTLFNIYIHPPSTGSPLKVPYNCSVCRGEGHPTGLCAFTKLPGWIDAPRPLPPMMPKMTTLP